MNEEPFAPETPEEKEDRLDKQTYIYPFPTENKEWREGDYQWQMIARQLGLID